MIVFRVARITSGGTYVYSLCWGFSGLDSRPIACCAARWDRYCWWHLD